MIKDNNRKYLQSSFNPSSCYITKDYLENYTTQLPFHEPLVKIYIQTNGVSMCLLSASQF